MEPLDTDFDYERLARAPRRRRSVKRDTRFNVMLIFPLLVLLWLLYLAGAALFQSQRARSESARVRHLGRAVFNSADSSGDLCR